MREQNLEMRFEQGLTVLYKYLVNDSGSFYLPKEISIEIVMPILLQLILAYLYIGFVPL